MANGSRIEMVNRYSGRLRDRRNSLRRLSALALGALLLEGSTAAASAQSVVGRVIDGANGTPLRTATVVLLDSADTPVDAAATDSAGWFALEAPNEGSFRLFAERLGYGDLHSDWLDVARDARVEVQVRMSAQAIAVEGVVVSVDSRYSKLDEVGFFARRRYAPGYHLDAAEIEEQDPTQLLDLLRMIPLVRGPYSMRVPPSCGRQPMRIVLDGSSLDLAWGEIDALVNPGEIIGLEVYPSAGSAGAPGEFRGPESYCGLVMIWTR